LENLSAAVLQQAARLARTLPAAGLVLYWEQVAGLEDVHLDKLDSRLILVVRGEKNRARAEQFSERVVVVPRAELTRQAQISLGVLTASARGFCNGGERLVCLAGPCGEAGGVDTIQVVDVSGPTSGLCASCSNGLGEHVPSQIFNAVLNLAVELAQEGREGKPIGTVFVLGDSEKVLQFSRQMVLNPFAGYPEASLNIVQPEMKETLREFASLDGAFVIRGDGTVIAAGRQLSASSLDLELPQGMGARHHAAAGITAVTEALALAISESSGTVTVFHHGQIIASLEKAGPPRPMLRED